jgi:hypothetical protein
MKTHKLNIFPFLHTSLSGTQNENGVELFPLYYRITYMRKNTMLRSFNKGVYANLDSTPIKKIIEQESKDIKALMELLTEMLTEPFDLTGIKAKYELAQMTVLEVFDKNIRRVASANLKNIDDEYAVAINVGEYSDEYPLTTLLNAVYELMPKQVKHVFHGAKSYLDYLDYWLDVHPLDSAQPRIIDWLDANDLDKKFIKYLKRKFDSEEKIIAIVDGIYELLFDHINARPM